jgi:hypothetical protein
MVRNMKIIYGKKKEDGKKRKRDKAPIEGTHSRNIPFSTSTCRIGQILRSAMQSMVCTMCLVTQLGSSWRHLPKQGIRTSHDRTW